VRAVEARVSWTPDSNLLVEFSVDADAARLRIPAPAAPVRADGLWRHTCFEIFLAAPDGERYCELNFSPSTAWAAYVFMKYREAPQPLALAAAPGISLTHSSPGLHLATSVPRDELVAALAPVDASRDGAARRRAPRLKLGIAAVIEDEAGTLSYWALRHPAPRPDFHHREGFAMELAESGEVNAT
jgi:hypothetical protein